MTHAHRPDVLVVGGGIIGLSIAIELADRGAKVKLIDRGELGREASWAGAGVLPPGSAYSPHPALEAMAARSNVLHPLLSDRLRNEAGVDDQFARCGAIYMTRPDASDGDESNGDADALRRWRALGAVVEQADALRLEGIVTPPRCVAYWTPAEAAVRNPRRLRGLVRLCEIAGVSIEAGCEALSVTREANRVLGVRAARGEIACGALCLAAGSWAGPLAEQLGVRAGIKPVRGQIALLRASPGLLKHVVHDHDVYLAPRLDGRVVVGATVEDVGFDKSTQIGTIERLVERARRLAPPLRQAEIERAWAGLRPATCDGLPVLGRIGDIQNAFFAGGHFRAGLHLAPSTAELVCDTIEGQPLKDPFGALAATRFCSPPELLRTAP